MTVHQVAVCNTSTKMLTQSLCNFERSDYSVPSKTKDAQEKTYNQEQKQNKLKASSLSRIPTTSTTRGRRNGDDNNYEDDAEPEQPGSDLDSVLEALGRCSTTSLCRKPKNAMNEKMRDIERNNATLLRRIIANNHRTNQFMPNARPGPVNVSHASVNRKKRQTQIDRDNLVSTIN